MARPIEFDYDYVIKNALQQFWAEGFEASSVQKLLDATAINRGTLYNSFGDKDTFFRSCAKKYNADTKANIDATLSNAALKPLKAIEEYFDLAVLSISNKQRALGCLLVNSVCESINWDKEMQKFIKSSLNVIRKGFLNRTKELEKAKGLKKGLTAEVATDILMNTLNGLRVDSRIGKAPKQMTALVEFTIGSIKK